MSQSRVNPKDPISQKDEQQAFNQTIQRSVTDLIRENETLRGELKSANEKNAILEEENAAFEEDDKDRQHAFEATEFLLEAEMLFNIGNYAKSKDVLQNANAHVLSEQGKNLYKWLLDKLRKKGYNLQGQ